MSYFVYEDLRSSVKEFRMMSRTKDGDSVVSIKVPVRWLPAIAQIAEDEMSRIEKKIQEI